MNRTKTDSLALAVRNLAACRLCRFDTDLFEPETKTGQEATMSTSEQNVPQRAIIELRLKQVEIARILHETGRFDLLQDYAELVACHNFLFRETEALQDQYTDTVNDANCSDETRTGSVLLQIYDQCRFEFFVDNGSEFFNVPSTLNFTVTI